MTRFNELVELQKRFRFAAADWIGNGFTKAEVELVAGLLDREVEYQEPRRTGFLTTDQRNLANIIRNLDVPKIDRPLTTKAEFRRTVCRWICHALMERDPALAPREFFAACGITRLRDDDRAAIGLPIKPAKSLKK